MICCGKKSLPKKAVKYPIYKLYTCLVFPDKADLAKRGELIEDMDILIAATSIATNAVLVTGNSKHFERIKTLQILSL